MLALCSEMKGFRRAVTARLHTNAGPVQRNGWFPAGGYRSIAQKCWPCAATWQISGGRLPRACTQMLALCSEMEGFRRAVTARLHRNAGPVQRHGKSPAGGYRALAHKCWPCAAKWKVSGGRLPRACTQMLGESGEFGESGEYGEYGYDYLLRATVETIF